MAQRNAQTDVRILLIAGIQLPGLLNISEVGVEEDEIEVPELGKIRKIGAGIEKIMSLELTFLVKRDSKTLKYFLDWRTAGKEARDVTMYYTDRSGLIDNAYRRDTWTDCELLDVKNPAFDQGSRDKAKLSVKLAPYDYDTRALL